MGKIGGKRPDVVIRNKSARQKLFVSKYWTGRSGFEGKKHSLETKEKMRTKANMRKVTKEQIERLKKISVLGITKQQTMKEPTSIEKKVYEELRLRRLLFETQKIVNGKFLVDAYIPSLNLIIECDGDYWHSLERVKKKDKAENAYLIKCGFNLLRLSETEINNENFKNRLEVN